MTDTSNFWTREASVTMIGKGTDRAVRVVASTESEDSHGTVLRNWDLSRYEQNPAVLFAHDRSDLPIGKASNVRLDNGQLSAVITFAEAELNPKAEQCLRMVRAGMLRAVSVGFCQGPRTKIATEHRGGHEVLVVNGPQLAEISVLAVGSNADALIRALDSGYRVHTPAARRVPIILTSPSGEQIHFLCETPDEALRRHAEDLGGGGVAAVLPGEPAFYR